MDYSSDKDKYIYDKADYDAMRTDLLQSNWEYEYSGKPKWKVRGTFPVSKSIQEAIRNKHKQHRQWMARKGWVEADLVHLTYTKASNKVKSMIRKAKSMFEKGIGEKCQSNPKLFWGHVRSRLKTKSGVAPLLKDVKDKNSAQFDDVEKTNILQDQFSSVFTREPDGETPSLNKRTDTSICNLQISYKIVQEEINNLNVNESCGPDEVHPRMLIESI